MSFRNRIRLPFKLHKPQFLEQAERYRRGDGSTKTLSVVVRKVYEGITDRLPEKLHERLKIALVHDEVQVEGDKYVGVVTQEGDYQIEWQDFLSHPLAQAKFKAEVTPFNATNSNCGTCAEYTQVVCNDDQQGSLNEDTTYDVDVLANDEICCNPVSISLVTYNSTFIDTISITPSNTILFHIKNGAPSATGVVLVTYRAQCQNGQYDEANVIADINGAAPPTCAEPTNVTISDVQPFQATLNWDLPIVAVFGYDIKVYASPDFVTPVQSLGAVGGDTSKVITGLNPNTDYRIYIRAICDVGGIYSNFVYVDFTTTEQPQQETCGMYELFNTDSDNYRSATYINCDGLFEGANIPPLHQREICMLQTSPGVPYNFNTEPQVNVVYLGICY